MGRGDGAGFSLGSLHVSFFGSWVGWVGRSQEAAPIGLPSYFLSGRLGRMGGPRQRAPPFMFLFWVLGRMGGPRQRSWASIEFPSNFLSGLLGRIPSCFLLSGLLGRMGGPRPRSRALLGLVGLPSCFLLSGSWVGWGGPRQRSWAPVGFPSSFLSGLLGRMGGPRPRSWAPVALPSCFLLSGSWVGWVGRSKEAGLPLDSLHISFLRY